jgi:serine/threonine protein phosphatase PrpC
MIGCFFVVRMTETALNDLKPEDDHPTPLLTPRDDQENQTVMLPTGEHICYVCRRKLGSAEMLRKHEELSSLHQKNLRIAKNLAQRKRHEIRGDVVRLRHMVVSGSPSAADRELQRLESELGHVQSGIEGEVESTCIFPILDSKFSVEISGLSWTGNKSTNEDRMCLDIDIGNGFKGFLIADGHCGDICADYLVTNLGKNVREAFETTNDIDEALRKGFQKTDHDFIEYAVANEVPSGSTAIMCVMYPLKDQDGQIACVMAHVGDSRGLVLSKSAVTGAVERLTEDHKPDRPDEKERLASSGGHVVEVGGIWRVFTPNIVSIGGRTLQWGLAVSRAFGDLALKKPSPIVIADPEISRHVTLNDEAVVVIACDGIFDVLTDEEVMTHSSGGPAEILRAAYGKLSDDNLTAIVCRIHRNEEPGTPKISSESTVEESTAVQSSTVQRRPSVMSEPSGKKQRHLETRKSIEAPEMVTPSQQISLDN